MIVVVVLIDVIYNKNMNFDKSFPVVVVMARLCGSIILSYYII